MAGQAGDASRDFSSLDQSRRQRSRILLALDSSCFLALFGTSILKSPTPLLFEHGEKRWRGRGVIDELRVYFYGNEHSRF